MFSPLSACSTLSLSALLFSSTTSALPNGLGITPQMGYNSWCVHVDAIFLLFGPCYRHESVFTSLSSRLNLLCANVMYVFRYDLMCSPSMNETVIAQRAQWFKDHGFDKLGYEYVNLDDCFIAKGTCAVLG